MTETPRRPFYEEPNRAALMETDSRTAGARAEAAGHGELLPLQSEEE